MLSIKNISANQAVGYYDKDSYYTSSAGEWQGNLKKEFGLPDEVTKEHFDKIIKKNPKRAGFDLCFSAPKSVSIQMFVSDELKKELLEAHNQAVQKTLEYIEKEAIHTRKTVNKKTFREYTGNFLCAKFNHFVSREQDPQLHTHCVVTNYTRGKDGQMMAIANELIYTNKILYGQVYRNLLAKNLIDKGYEIQITDLEHGFFELKGMTTEQLAAFSKRRNQIKDILNKWDNQSAKAASVATTLSRNTKKQIVLESLVEIWCESFKEQGINAIDKNKDNDKLTVQTDNDKQIYYEKAVEELTHKVFAFNKHQFLTELMRQGLKSGLSYEDTNDFFKTSNDIILLGKNQKGVTYFCTRKALEIEQNVFEIFKAAHNDQKMPGVDLEIIEKYLKETTLSPKQKAVVKHVCNNNDSLTAIQGLAGVGKTTMLKTAKTIFEENGYEVRGLCFTGKATSGLRNETGMDCSTIHSFLNGLEKEAGNKIDIAHILEKKEWNFSGLQANEKKEIWFIDEASIINNSLMMALLQAAQIKQAKIILVGDRWQLPPIGSGNAFEVGIDKNLIDKVEIGDFEDIHRQKKEPLKKAVYEAVKGEINQALKILETSASIKQIKNDQTRLKKIAEEFVSTGEEREKSIILVGTNYERETINNHVRDNLKNQGLLTNGIEIKIDTLKKEAIKEFALGEMVIFLKNDKKLNCYNGDKGVITELNENEMVVRVNDNLKKINFKEYNYFDHGYAMTSHKAQGLTAEGKVFVNINTKLINNRNRFYVDLSRASEWVKIYTDDTKEMPKCIKNFEEKLSSLSFKDFNPEKHLEKKQKEEPSQKLSWKEHQAKEHQKELKEKKEPVFLKWFNFKNKSKIENKIDKGKGVSM